MKTKHRASFLKLIKGSFERSNTPEWWFEINMQNEGLLHIVEKRPCTTRNESEEIPIHYALWHNRFSKYLVIKRLYWYELQISPCCHWHRLLNKIVSISGKIVDFASRQLNWIALWLQSAPYIIEYCIAYIIKDRPASHTAQTEIPMRSDKFGNGLR